MVERIFHRGRLEAAMDHAVGAFFVIASAIGVPVGLLHQLLEARRIAFTEKITRPLPAEDRARRIAPMNSFDWKKGQALPPLPIAKICRNKVFVFSRLRKCGWSGACS